MKQVAKAISSIDVLSDHTVSSPAFPADSVSAEKTTLKIPYPSFNRPCAETVGLPPFSALLDLLLLIPDSRKLPESASTNGADTLTLRASITAASLARGRILWVILANQKNSAMRGFWLSGGSYGSGEELRISRALGLKNRSQERGQSFHSFVLNKWGHVSDCLLPAV